MRWAPLSTIPTTPAFSYLISDQRDQATKATNVISVNKVTNVINLTKVTNVTKVTNLRAVTKVAPPADPRRDRMSKESRSLSFHINLVSHVLSSHFHTIPHEGRHGAPV